MIASRTELWRDISNEDTEIQRLWHRRIAGIGVAQKDACQCAYRSPVTTNAAQVVNLSV